MSRTHAFDALYTDTRADLLPLVWALSGDLDRARQSSEQAYAAAWQNWRKVSLLDDPYAWVRNNAHSRARRGMRAPGTDQGDASQVSTLRALHRLSRVDRDVLLLVRLASLDAAAAGRVAGVAAAQVPEILDRATARFAELREIEPTGEAADARLAELRSPAPVEWTPVEELRHAGGTTRRRNTAVGAALAFAVMIGSGLFVHSFAGDERSLAEERLSGDPAPTELPRTAPAAVTLEAQQMLAADQVRRLAAGRKWKAGPARDSLAKDLPETACRQQRLADPEATAALTRRFTADGGKGQPRIAATESTELAATPKAAREAYQTTLDWYAGCSLPRVQLLDAQQLPGVGDQSMLLVLRSWAAPVTTHTVVVSRTRRFVISVAREQADDAAPDLQSISRTAAAAVNRLCGRPGAGTCAAPPKLEEAALPRVGDVPWLLDTVDLPPVSGVDQPWSSTNPAPPTQNVAASRCDNTSFARMDIKPAFTRSFLFPESKLPETFGLTQTAGRFGDAGKAKAFVGEIRGKLGGCQGRDLTATVDELRSESSGDRDVVAWRVRTEISDTKSFDFLMGVVRRGTAVTQLGFLPAGDATLSDEAFSGLLDRAGRRLELAPQGGGGAPEKKQQGDEKKADKQG